MVEISNRLLEDILRKADTDWEMALNKSTGNLNGRVVQHLGVAPSNILLGVTGTPLALDSTMRSAGSKSAQAWIKELMDPVYHAEAVREYFNYRAQIHDTIRQRSDEKKDRKGVRFSRGINEIEFSLGQILMLYQKDTGKSQACWRCPFRIDGFGGSHNVSYKLRQCNGKNNKGIFHGNHLKPFTLRRGYLANNGPTFPAEQTIRASRPRRKRKAGG